MLNTMLLITLCCLILSFQIHFLRSTIQHLLVDIKSSRTVDIRVKKQYIILLCIPVIGCIMLAGLLLLLFLKSKAIDGITNLKSFANDIKTVVDHLKVRDSVKDK